MRLLADLHTHSNNSRFFHGKNTIEEMVNVANALGLEEIAITDHGYLHMCRTSKEKLKKARELIDEINTWSKTRVLLGVEADIISEDGSIDIDNETLAMLDILLVGYHRMIKTDFAGFFGGKPKTEEAKQKCTNAFVNAIQKNPITILTHVDSVLSTDLYKIGCACRDKGVLVEINNRHTNWNDEQMEQLLASGCTFVVSSDAHRREMVGEVSRAIDLIKKYNIPNRLIANVEFDEFEKSDDEKEIDFYYDLYKSKLSEKELKELELEEKKEKEFTDTLSKEMEDALENIAKDKGYKYENKRVDEDVSLNMPTYYNSDADDLIMQAKSYLEELDIEISEEKSKNRAVETDVGEKTSKKDVDNVAKTKKENILEDEKLTEKKVSLNDENVKESKPIADNSKDKKLNSVNSKQDDSVSQIDQKSAPKTRKRNTKFDPLAVLELDQMKKSEKK